MKRAPLSLFGTLGCWLWLLLALLLAMPGRARAYTVLAPGELLRMDVLLAWEAGEEVLLLSPVVRGGGILLMPLPADAQIVTPRPEAASWLALKDPRPPKKEMPEGSALPSFKPDRPGTTGRPEPEAPKIPSTGESPTAGLLRPPPSIESAKRLQLVPLEELAATLSAIGVSEQTFATLDLGAPEGATEMILVAQLPRDSEAVRVAPFAVTFDSVWPRLPLVRRPTAPAHALSLRVLGATPVRDLGGMDFAFGLRRAGSGEVPVSLLAWLEASVAGPGTGWRASDLSALAFDAGRAAASKLHDLRLPPTLGARLQTPKKGSIQTPKAEAATDPKDGCEGCAQADGRRGPQRSAWSLLLGLFSLWGLLRRRTPGRARHG